MPRVKKAVTEEAAVETDVIEEPEKVTKKKATTASKKTASKSKRAVKKEPEEIVEEKVETETETEIAENGATEVISKREVARKENDKIAKKVRKKEKFVKEVINSEKIDTNEFIKSDNSGNGKKREIKKDGKIISLDGSLVASTESQKLSEAFRDINDSMYNKRILTANILGIQRIRTNGFYIPCPYIIYKDIKIVFTPVSFGVPKFISESIEQNSFEYYSALNKYYSGSVGAEVDFLVSKELSKDKVLPMYLGDRVTAMKIYENKNYFATDKSGYYTLNEGNRIEARVVNTRIHSLTIEARGVEADIPIDEVSYNYGDLREEYCAGDRVIVRILDIDRNVNEKKVVKLTVSIKSELADPFIKWTKALKRGDTLIGEVAHIDSSGYYVKISTSSDSFTLRCSLTKGRVERPIVGSSVMLTYMKCDPVHHILYGNIVRVVKL